jgi:phosphoenolpyruvate carboxylase
VIIHIHTHTQTNKINNKKHTTYKIQDTIRYDIKIKKYKKENTKILSHKIKLQLYFCLQYNFFDFRMWSFKPRKQNKTKQNKQNELILIINKFCLSYQKTIQI